MLTPFVNSGLLDRWSWNPVSLFALSVHVSVTVSLCPPALAAVPARFAGAVGIAPTVTVAVLLYADEAAPLIALTR